ncbi:hypothetical protein [Haloplanus pelagicus]|uniref:hypothetical protein n=1 Tax=Haloplanus pelagicus TaxID=2949995 RepID=UPI003CE573E4
MCAHPEEGFGRRGGLPEQGPDGVGRLEVEQRGPSRRRESRRGNPRRLDDRRRDGIARSEAVEPPPPIGSTTTGATPVARAASSARTPSVCDFP